MQPEVRFATSAEGVRIAWTSIGSGPTLVHLPGVPFSNLEAEWRIPVLQRAFARLGERVRFVQFDGRGTGRSQREVDDVSLEAHVRDADAVIEATGAAPVVLFGFYHSALTGIAWAARHPERVRGLVLYGGTLRGWDAMRGPGTQALLSLIERDWDTFVESVTHAWLGWPNDADGRLAADWFRGSTSPALARATLQAAAEADVSGMAGKVTCPALVLHRAEATVIPLDLSQELADALPRGRLEVLPGATASLFFDDTDDVVDRLIDFTLDPDAPPRAGERRVGGRADATIGGTALSAREREVLRLIARGESNGQIAASLGLSINTVERHVSNAYRKIDVRGRAEATAWAIRNGLA